MARILSLDDYEKAWWVRLGRFLRLNRVEILEVNVSPSYIHVSSETTLKLFRDYLAAVIDDILLNARKANSLVCLGQYRG